MRKIENNGVLGKFALGFVIVAIITAIIVSIVDGGSSNLQRAPPPKPQCNDKIDNDVDNTIDYGGFKGYPPDSDCSSSSDNTECGVACSSSSNCGTNGYGARYCYNSDVYQDYTSYNCNSPGTCGAYCTNTVTPNLIQDCQATNPDGYCSNGQCVVPPNSCSDSDGGIDKLVLGSTSGYSGGYPYTSTDYCESSTTLGEYYCSNTFSYLTLINCVGGGTNSCLDGRCIYSAPPDSCSDSDGGVNIAVQGYTSGYYGGALYNNTDSCVDSANVREYSCSGTQSVGQTLSCSGSDVCQNGRCVTPPPQNTCSDTDGGYHGINAYLQGTISGLQNDVPYSYTDYCATSTSVHEYYCGWSGSSYNSPSAFDMPCEGNTTNICSNGACAP